MFDEFEKAKILSYYNIALKRIKENHIGLFKDHKKPVMLISEAYPGVWLEHVYDAVLFSKLEPAYLPIAQNTIELFIDNQREDGQLPCFVLDGNKRNGNPQDLIGFSQLQECLSFASLCLEVFKAVAKEEFILKCYASLCLWVDWLCSHRMTLKTGLVEMFVGYDTGHDNSGRLNGMKAPENRLEGGERLNAGVPPAEDDIAPIIAVDLNCNFYATLKALEQMAKMLNMQKAAEEWAEKAKIVKKKLFELCYDKEDAFFYDVDKHGNKRKYLSCTIFHLFMEGVLDQEEDSETIENIYTKHIKNPNAFWTEYPFPSMAVCDPSCVNHQKKNCWGYYSQALIVLRCTLWMDKYHMTDDFDAILEKWITKWTFGNSIMFGQELDPITGEATNCSEWYSSCMLLYIYAVRRLGLLSH